MVSRVGKEGWVNKDRRHGGRRVGERWGTDSGPKTGVEDGQRAEPRVREVGSEVSCRLPHKVLLSDELKKRRVLGSHRG